MTEADRELFAQVMQFERERMIAHPPAPPKPLDPPTIHFSELPPAAPNSRGAADRDFYRREVGRLLAEGNEGRWVLIEVTPRFARGLRDFPRRIGNSEVARGVTSRQDKPWRPRASHPRN